MPAPKVVVIGGGISGLVTAYYLSRSNADVTLLEASPRLGGVIETQRCEGFVLESGAESFLSEKPWALELCTELGIESELMGTEKAHRKSLVLKNGKLYPFPEGFYLFSPSSIKALLMTPALSLAGKLRMAAEIFVPRLKDGEESVSQFISRRFGKEALERIGQPMVGGIYMADPEKLSLDAVLPKFREMEKQHGSIIKALAQKRGRAVEKASGPRYSLFVSFKGGMEKIIQTLAEKIGKDRIKLSAPVKEMMPVSGGGWKVVLSDGSFLEAEAVCVAVPAPQAAKLLPFTGENCTSELNAIPYEPAVTINFGFLKKDFCRPLDAFGFVVPQTENKILAACTFSSVKWRGRAPEDAVLLRAFAGGAFGHNLPQDDAVLTEKILKELQEALGIQARPFFIQIKRLPKSMPQYHVGHFKRVERIEAAIKQFPGLYITGSAYRGVGISDCVYAAKKTAEAMRTYAQKNPARKSHAV